MRNCISPSLFASLLIFLTLSFAGCGGDSPDTPEKPEPEKPTPENPTPEEPDTPVGELPVPGLSFTSIALANEGDEFSCVIRGLTDNSWSAECDKDWCTASIRGNVLTLSVTPNDTDGRIATVSILHSDKRVMGRITVTQSLLTEEPLENSTSSKHTFFPMFTATWCPFSPDLDRTLTEIQKRWSYTILPMHIHVNGSELYTPLSDELSVLYDNYSSPTGYFENFFKVSSVHEGNVSLDYFWNLILTHVNTNDSYTKSCSSIGCKSSLSDDKIKAEISINPVEAGQYRLLAFILEDNIIKPQMTVDNAEISDYCHNGVLIGTLTPLIGQELELTASQKTVSLTGDVPANFDPSNLRLLIVLEHNVEELNYSANCWYADNCISVPLGKSAGNGMIENIFIGEDIEN